VDSSANSLSATSSRLDSTGQPFYWFSLNSEGLVTEHVSRELPFAPVSELQQEWQLLIYFSFFFIPLVLLSSLYVCF